MESNSDISRQGKFLRIGTDLYEMKISRHGKSIHLSDEAVDAIANRIFPMVQKQQNLEQITLKASAPPEPDFKDSFNAIDRLIDSDLSKREVHVKHDKAPSFLMKIYEFFEKRVSPEKYESRHKAYAERLVSESPLKAEKTRRFEIKKDEQGIKYAVMPKGIETSKEEIQATLRSHKIGADTAVKKKWHKNVETLKSGGIHVVPYKIHGTKVKQGKVTPTSFVHAKEVETQKKGRLTNIYLAEGKNIMRSGVINTPEKAEAFIKAAKQFHSDKEKPLRIVSNQLNSPEWERKLITAQHQSLTDAGKKDPSVQIAHFVTPTNRFYHLAKKLGPVNFLWGEKKARENNRAGLSTYLEWIRQDHPELGIDPKNLEGAYEKIAKIDKRDDTLELFKRFLGNQLQKKEDKMERGQELLVLHLLNQKMGVVSTVNCKSGLDRTGFVFSMMMALSQMTPEKQMDLVLNWDTYTEELNQKMRAINYDTAALYEWVNRRDDKKETYLAILDFRLQLFENLVKVGMPITATSTGLLGIKWEKGIRQNLVPLNFLPPVIKVEGEATPVQIIEYDAKGEPSGLTERGHRLIVQLTNRREA